MTAWRHSLEKLGLHIAPGVGGFFTWWRRSLLAWLPVRWQVQLDVSRARLLLWRDDETLHLVRQLGPQLDPIATLPWPQAPEAVDRALGSRLASLPHVWVLSGAHVLRRPMRLPIAASARLRDVLGFEIDRQTPFQSDQVHYDVRECGLRDDGHLDVELVVVPRRVFDAEVDTLGEWRERLAGVDVGDGQHPPLGVNLLPAQARQQRGDPLRRWNLLFAAVAVLALIAAGWQLLDNRNAALASLRAQVDAEARRARTVSVQRQQLLDQIEGASFFDQQAAARPSMTEIIDELSRRLPTGTYLEKLSVEGNQLQLIGLSREASSLVQRLEGSPLWHTPSLTGVLQSNAATHRDRFTLTAELNKEPVKPAKGGSNGQGRR